MKEVMVVVKSIPKTIINKKINMLMVLQLLIDQEISLQQIEKWKGKGLLIEERERREAGVEIDREEGRVTKEREVEAVKESNMIEGRVDLEREEERGHENLTYACAILHLYILYCLIISH